MVGVAEDDRGAERLEVAVQRGLHAALRADGHERRRLDRAVRRVSVPRRAAPSAARRLNPKRDTGIIRPFSERSCALASSSAAAPANTRCRSPRPRPSSSTSIRPATTRSPSRSPRTGAGRWARRRPRRCRLPTSASRRRPRRSCRWIPSAALQDSRVDVVFPVLHGPYGEDGTVQGLLELANVPYVGAGVLGSAVGMDKAVMKALFAADDLPIVPHLTVLRRDWERDARRHHRRRRRDLRYPVFVKPANLGSSVGISKASPDESLADAMRLALRVRSQSGRRGRSAGRARDRMRGPGQRRPRGLGARRDHRHARRRLLLVCRQVPRPQRRVVADPGGHRARDRRGWSAA